MEGDLARLPEIVAARARARRDRDPRRLARRRRPRRARLGTPEHFGLRGEIDVVTGTLGKALGGAAGGYVAASADICELLAQRSAPAALLERPPGDGGVQRARRRRRRFATTPASSRRCARTPPFRAMLVDAGFAPIPGDSAIIPIVLGETAIGDPLLGAPARARRLRHRFRLPRRAGGHRPRARPDVCGPRARAPRAGPRRVRRGRPGVRRCSPSRAPAPSRRAGRPSRRRSCRSHATPRPRRARRGRSADSGRRDGNAPALPGRSGISWTSTSNGRGAVGCRSTSSAVSSRASRSAAASSESSSGSTCPPGCSSRPSFTCSTRHVRTPPSSITNAEAVKCADGSSRESGSASS